MQQNVVFHDGYMFKLYSHRGQHFYYRCANRKQNCKARLNVDIQKQIQTQTGEHLPECQKLSPALEQMILQQINCASINNINSSQSSQIQNYIPEEMKLTLDGQPFIQFLSAFPTFSMILYTKQMSEFSSLCTKLVFQFSSTFYPIPFHKFMVILGACENIIKPVAFFIMNDAFFNELTELYHFLEIGMDFSKVVTVYSPNDPELLQFCSSICSDVRLGLFHFMELTSPPDILRYLALVPPDSAKAIIPQLEAIRGAERSADVFKDLSIKPDSFWNVFGDAEFQSYLYPIQAELDRIFKAGSWDIYHNLREFAQQLQQIEFNLRIPRPCNRNIIEVFDWNAVLNETIRKVNEEGKATNSRVAVLKFDELNI